MIINNNIEITQVKFDYNPFAGIIDNDLEHIIMPKFDVEEMKSIILKSESIAVEFLGKQGRGKTTNLRYLQKLMPTVPLFMLEKGARILEILDNESNTVFVDSIHHLNFFERIRLFKEKKQVIYTTHWSRRISCVLANKALRTIKFKGIDAVLLRQILNKRLKNASRDPLNNEALFTTESSQKLIQKFGDNYRAIINHLYKSYL